MDPNTSFLARSQNDKHHQSGKQRASVTDQSITIELLKDSINFNE